MTGGRGVFRNSMIYGAAHLLQRGAGFLLLPVFSHYISPAEFGALSLIFVLYTLLLAVIASGFESSFSKFYLAEENDHKRKEIFSVFIIIVTILAVSGSVMLWLLDSFISQILFDSLQYAYLIRLYALILFFESINLIIYQFHKSREEVKRVVTVTTITAFVNIGLTLYFTVILRMGIAGIVYAALIAAVMAAIMLFPAFAKNICQTAVRPYLKSILVFAAPLIIAGLLSTLTDFIDRFILDHFYSTKEVGIYSFTYRIALVMNVFVISFRTAWTPHALNYVNESDTAQHFGRIFTKLISIGLIIMIGVAVLFPLLFQIKFSGYSLFHHQYQVSRIIPLIIMGGYLFSGIISFYSVYPYHSGKSKYFLISDSIVCSVNIFLNIILIPKLGFTGAAIATLAAFASGALFMLYISKGMSKVSYELKRISLLMLTGAFAAIVFAMHLPPWMELGLALLLIASIIANAGIKTLKPFA